MESRLRRKVLLRRTGGGRGGAGACIRTERTVPSHKYPAEEDGWAAQGRKRPSEKSAPAKQEVLQFEPVTRGRFEKSEPTIVEGEDLDVPTYLRKNIKVK